jgi:hypothetical protein
MVVSALFQVRFVLWINGDSVRDVLQVDAVRLMKRSAVSLGGTGGVGLTVVGDGSFGGGVGGVGVSSGTAMSIRRLFWLSSWTPCSRCGCSWIGNPRGGLFGTLFLK